MESCYTNMNSLPVKILNLYMKYWVLISVSMTNEEKSERNTLTKLLVLLVRCPFFFYFSTQILTSRYMCSEVFQNSRINLQNFGARMLAWSKLHTKELILDRPENLNVFLCFLFGAHKLINISLRKITDTIMLKILDATLKPPVTRANMCPGFVHPWKHIYFGLGWLISASVCKKIT
jgi:hypothetical protein